MSRRFPLMAVSAALALCGPALAQDGPKGIAFVQAPEQGGGVCTGATPEEGFACAVKQCMENGAADADCVRTNWCQPAGWSVDIFVQHQEGPHWHEVICGMPSEAIAKAAASHLCDMNERDYLIACTVVQVYDPEGIVTITP
ncbi:hypothetical protein [Oricola nitratireducens]|uniref:hypothetical protein n=1 Tax=Oricola nitratireducens TaxID=2775868 RepID=UPI001AEEEB94|nr:hypothetical protein [Oricola nitratireducens]